MGGLERAPSGHPVRLRPGLRSSWVAGGGAEVTAGWEGWKDLPPIHSYDPNKLPRHAWKH